jgi:hypothetical protein
MSFLKSLVKLPFKTVALPFKALKVVNKEGQKVADGLKKAAETTNNFKHAMTKPLRLPRDIAIGATIGLLTPSKKKKK